MNTSRIPAILGVSLIVLFAGVVAFAVAMFVVSV